MLRNACAAIALCLLASNAAAGDLVRVVRSKLSAGDLASGMAYAEDYRRDTGVDAEYLDAVGWLARGAEMLRRPDLAEQYVAELRREIPEEKPDLTVPFGAAIEVQGKLLLAREGRGPAIRFLEEQLALAKDTALRSRVRKNLNLLSLEGQPAPPIAGADTVGAPLPALEGKPVLLFLWANWCGDCKSQHAALSRIRERYRDSDLVIVAPTRLYGTVDQKAATPEEEKARIASVWRESYPGLAGVSVPVSEETMVRYGASATPTFVLIDRKGTVRLYAPTRLAESELVRRIDDVLAKPAR